MEAKRFPRKISIDIELFTISLRDTSKSILNEKKHIRDEY